MSFLSRDSSRQTARELGQLRGHLRELEDLREEQLGDLGDITFEMYQRDRFEGKLLWQKAAEIAAIDDEAGLVRRGLDEGLTLAELEQLARDEANRTASHPGPAPVNPSEPPSGSRAAPGAPVPPQPERGAGARSH